MPPLVEGSSGHLAFRRAITCYVRMSRSYLRVTNGEVYIQSHIDIYVRVSLGGHNLGTIYANKLRFIMLHSQTYICKSVIEMSL